jgi:hypothetical protein
MRQIALNRKRFVILFALSHGVSFLIPESRIADGFVLSSRRTSTWSVTRNNRNSFRRETQNVRRAQLVEAEEEEAELLIEALRGRSMNEDDRAAEGIRLQLIENINFNSGDSGGNGLSLLKEEYDPEALKQCKCACQ